MLITRLRAAATAAGLAAALLVAAPALALTDEDVVRPMRDDIALSQAAIAELARQGAARHAELEQWLAYRQGLAQALADNAARLQELHERDRTIAAGFVSVATALTPRGGDQAYVPHIGWGIFGFFEKHRDDTNAAIAEAEGAVAQGETQFHVAGTGWITGDQLEAQIAAARKAIDDLQAALDAGSWQIHYPGIGWVSRTALEARIAAKEAEIAGTLETIAKGDYQVHVPGIGWTTRNGVETMIANAESRFAEVTATFDGETAQIHRPIGGWITLAGVHAAMQSREDEIAGLQQAAADGSFQHHLPGIGWVTGDGLDAQITEALRGVAEVEAASAAGTYQVPSALGWTDRNRATEQLALPDCRPQGPSPCIQAEHRPHYQDVLARIPTAVQADVAVRELRIALLEAFRAAIGSHIGPRVDQLSLELAQWAATQNEFSQELGILRQNHERYVAWLRAVIDTQIP